MPVSKKRKKPEKKRRPREAGEAPVAAAPAEPAGGNRGGFLSRMRGGFQSMTGSGPKKPESLLSKILTWALVAAVAYFVAKRFGILK